MRLEVDTGAYASAMDLLYDANHGVIDGIVRLADAVDACGGMSGTDSGGRDWAESYDGVAGRLVRAGAALGGSMGATANLLDANLANHEGAEYAASLYPGHAGFEAGGGGLRRASERLSPADVPSAYGGTGGEPDGWRWLAAHLEGLLWPDADTDKMRAAAAAWLGAGSTLDGWSGSATDASYLMETQRSPEAPIAARATRELGRHGTELAAACRDVGNACHQYADQVDDSHREIVGTCQELLAWTAVDQVSGALLSFVTAGGAEVAAQLVESGVMARYAARVIGVLRRLVELARAAAALMSRGIGRIAEILARLKTFLSLKAVRALEKVGSSAAGRRALADTSELLAKSEKFGGHTLARHVGLSDTAMSVRRVRVESSYTDQSAAELGISRVLRKGADRIEAWMHSGSGDDLVLNGDAGQVIGRTLARGETTPVPTSHLRIVIRRNPTMPGDYYIHTSYPTP